MQGGGATVRPIHCFVASIGLSCAKHIKRGGALVLSIYDIENPKEMRHLERTIQVADLIVSLAGVVACKGAYDSSGHLTAQAFHLRRLRGFDPSKYIYNGSCGRISSVQEEFDPCSVEARGEEIR
ncbi:MAG: hypothetical protein Q8P55_00930 [bacterium]|nr:hypothetical protein [bacterium]